MCVPLLIFSFAAVSLFSVMYSQEELPVAFLNILLNCDVLI